MVNLRGEIFWSTGRQLGTQNKTSVRYAHNPGSNRPYTPPGQQRWPRLSGSELLFRSENGRPTFLGTRLRNYKVEELLLRASNQLGHSSESRNERTRLYCLSWF